MVRRFRDELAKGRDVPDAIAWSVATTGEAILFSGLTVMVGFCGLFLIGIPFMTSFGLGGALTVASAVLAALTLMPAILAILGPRINALRLPLFRRRYGPASDGSAGTGFWHSWALAVMRRPILVVLGCAALLLLKAVLVNVLSLAASYGVLVFVFQWVTSPIYWTLPAAVSWIAPCLS